MGEQPLELHVNYMRESGTHSINTGSRDSLPICHPPSNAFKVSFEQGDCLTLNKYIWYAVMSTSKKSRIKHFLEKMSHFILWRYHPETESNASFPCANRFLPPAPQPAFGSSYHSSSFPASRLKVSSIQTISISEHSFLQRLSTQSLPLHTRGHAVQVLMSQAWVPISHVVSVALPHMSTPCTATLPPSSQLLSPRGNRQHSLVSHLPVSATGSRLILFQVQSPGPTPHNQSISSRKDQGQAVTRVKEERTAVIVSRDAGSEHVANTTCCPHKSRSLSSQFQSDNYLSDGW